MKCPSLPVCCLLLAAVLLAGCGSTRSTDTDRTATEQLLISDAIDRAVSSLQFGELAGQSVFLDDHYVEHIVDSPYLVSTLRQQLLASGCVLKERRSDADFVVEARAGAVGTNRHDLLFGVPSTNLPQILPFQALPAAIPEIPIAKRRDQRGVAKVAVFAYHRETGQPVWQSGIAQQESSLNDVWLLGAGPFRHGTIQKETAFAGRKQHEDLLEQQVLGLAKETSFADPAVLTASPKRLPQPEQDVQWAQYETEAAAAVPKKPATPVAVAEAPRYNDSPAPGLLDLPEAEEQPAWEVSQTQGLLQSPGTSNVQVSNPESFAPPEGSDLVPLPQPRIDGP